MGLKKIKITPLYMLTIPTRRKLVSSDHRLYPKISSVWRCAVIFRMKAALLQNKLGVEGSHEKGKNIFFE